MDDIDLSFNEKPMCPYCGHEENEAWEIDFGQGIEGDTTIECGECGKEYFCERNATITYSTKVIKQ